MSSTNLVDIGANLTHESFRADFDEVVSAATAAGVQSYIVAGASVSDSQAAVAIAQRQADGFYATAGVHPHHAKDWQDGDDATLRELAQHSVVRAVGECGLDYFRNFSSPQQQQQVFREQLQIAVDLNMPVYLHQRDAHADFIAILDDYRAALPRAVAHCFTGTGAELDAYLERDLYIGITGWICDERRGHHLRDLVARIPSNRLMIETDSPYLLPRDIRPKPKGRRNEPKYLPYVLRAVASACDLPEEEVAANTTAAARDFFDF